MAYRVTAGHVEVDTGEPRTQTRVERGALLPDDVSQEQIVWELNLGTVEEVADEPAAKGDEDGPDADPEGENEDPGPGTPVDS